MPMTIFALWGLFWILIAGTTLVVGGLAWYWWHAIRQRNSATTPSEPVGAAAELLQAHARIASLKPQSTVPPVSPGAGRWQALVQQGSRQVKRLGVGLALVVLVGSAGAVRGLIWEIQRHPPLPPNASAISENLIVGIARQTTFRVPDSVDAIREFYQRELPPRDWSYCGTQNTPRCANLAGPGGRDEIDIYRRPDDRDFTGLTIEVWVRRDRDGLTFVTVFETWERSRPPS